MRTILLLISLGMLLTSSSFAEDRTLQLVVMDPLAAPLSCDCVKGYAQRKYEKLGEYLARKLARPVKVTWSESLVKASKETSGATHLVIGKHSVVLHDAKTLERRFTPLASLTGSDGETTQTGLVVVRTGDPAQEIRNLAGYRVFFGPEECDEKCAVMVEMLKEAKLPVPTERETYPSCSTAASKLMELDAGEKAVAVISSYAEPLLAGCGAVKKGDLRVIARSKPIPFITAFADVSLPAEEQEAIRTALMDMAEEPDLLQALETEAGFVPFEESPAGDAAGEATAAKK